MHASPGIPKVAEGRAPTPLLRVNDLGVSIRCGANERLRLLEGIDCEIYTGEMIGLLGESGAGKTTLARAIMGLLPASTYLVEGSIAFKGIPLLSLKECELQRIRGAEVSLVHQDSSVLNPFLRVGDQIVEVLRAHRNWSGQQYRNKAISLLQDLAVPDAERVYAAYPHQLSGGQRQRIALAQALACEPTLLIADEPTSSLDAATTTEVLRLLVRLKWHRRTTVVLISHEWSVLAQVSDRLMIMCAGRIVEQGAWADVLRAPLHPYTCALLECGSQMQTADHRDSNKYCMPTMAGWPAGLSGGSRGCDFVNRCPDQMKICGTHVPEEMHVSKSHSARCFKVGG